MNIITMSNNIIFNETCCACPEQYDVYCSDEKVGYVRYRSGKITCEFPECGDEMIYNETIGDEYDGRMTEEQRKFHLDKISKIIEQKLDEIFPIN